MKFTLRGKRIQEGWGKRELALQLFTRESSSLPGGFIPVYWRTRGSDVEFPWREWQLRRCNREGDDFEPIKPGEIGKFSNNGGWKSRMACIRVNVTICEE